MKKKVIALLGTCFLSMGLLFIPGGVTLHNSSCWFGTCNIQKGFINTGVNINAPTTTTVCVAGEIERSNCGQNG